MSRPSPTESATIFPSGTVKRGNDGNLWIVKLTSKGFNRWVKYHGDSSNKSNNNKQTQKTTSTSKSKRTRKSKSKRTRKSKSKRTRKSKSKRTRKSKSKRTRKSKSKRTRKSKSKRTRKSKSKRTRKSNSKRTRKSPTRKSKSKRTRKSESKSKRKSSKRSPTRKSKSKRTRKSKSKRTRKSKRKSKSKRTRKSKSSQKKTSSKRTREFSSSSTRKSSGSGKFKGVMLAQKYTNQDIIGYYISEKLDGYRAIFTKNGFVSRNNKPFNAPSWFINDILNKLPSNITMLDGELYTKRGDFKGMGVVRKKNPVDEEWRNISFHVFDLPLINLPFEERYELLQTLKNVPHIKIVKHTKIKSMEQFYKIHKDLVNDNAEGSMLREPGSYYENKRSKTLLKVKDFLDDEVRIIGHKFGSGKYSNVLGALTVKWVKKSLGDNEFEVGSGFNDDERNNYKKEFPIGSIITIKYFEIDNKSKKARFPIYLRKFSQ